MINPSDKALVPFVSVDNMMALVNHIGLEKILIDLASEIECDFVSNLEEATHPFIKKNKLISIK